MSENENYIQWNLLKTETETRSIQIGLNNKKEQLIDQQYIK